MIIPEISQIYPESGKRTGHRKLGARFELYRRSNRNARRTLPRHELPKHVTDVRQAHRALVSYALVQLAFVRLIGIQVFSRNGSPKHCMSRRPV